MPLRFLNLFTAARNSADGLVQPQREAIADALHYLVFADNHVAAREGEYLDEKLGGFEWDSSLAFSTYETLSIANARRAKEDAEYRHAFLGSIAARLNTPESRARALSLAQGLVWADGSAAAGESAALAELESVLKP